MAVFSMPSVSPLDAAGPATRSSDHPGVFASCSRVRTPISASRAFVTGAHAPHEIDGQVVKEVQLGGGIDNHQTVGLALRGLFSPGAWCARRRPRLESQALPAHGSDRACNFGWWTEEMGATRDIGKGLVDGNSLHERCEIIEHLDDGIACLLRGRKSFTGEGVGCRRGFGADNRRAVTAYEALPRFVPTRVTNFCSTTSRSTARRNHAYA